MPAAPIGRFTRRHDDLVIRHAGQELLRLSATELATSWKRPMDFDGTMTGNSPKEHS